MHHKVTVKPDTEVCQVPYANGSIVLLIVGHEQGVHTINVLDGMNDEMGIPRPIHRNDAVVVIARTTTELAQNLPQFLATLLPVQFIFFFVHPASTTNPFVIKGEIQGVMGSVQAARADLHQMTSFSIRKKSIFSSTWSFFF
jgi:hypothetical protein